MPSDKRARQRAYRQQKRAEQERRRKRRRYLIGSGWALAVVAIVVVVVALTSSNGKPAPSTKSKTRTSTTVLPGTTVAPTTAVPTTTEAPPPTVPAAKVAVAPTCPPATPAGDAKRVIEFTKAPPTCVAPTSVFDVTFVTDVGTFVARMDTAASPAAVNNFVFLARYHFFDGTTFPRVVPGFVIQGGSTTDSTASSPTSPGYSFTGNTPPKSCTAKKDCYPIWSMAMANSSGPSTNSSQFFVVLPGGQQTLDQEPNYTLFGQVISGTKVLQTIAAGGAPDPNPPKVLHHIKSVTVSQVAA